MIRIFAHAGPFCAVIDVALVYWHLFDYAYCIIFYWFCTERSINLPTAACYHWEHWSMIVFITKFILLYFAFSAWTLLVRPQEWFPVRKNFRVFVYWWQFDFKAFWFSPLTTPLSIATESSRIFWFSGTRLPLLFFLCWKMACKWVSFIWLILCLEVFVCSSCTCVIREHWSIIVFFSLMLYVIVSFSVQCFIGLQYY